VACSINAHLGSGLGDPGAFILEYDNYFGGDDDGTGTATDVAVSWHGVRLAERRRLPPPLEFTRAMDPKPHVVLTHAWFTPEEKVKDLEVGKWQLDVTLTPDGGRAQTYACKEPIDLPHNATIKVIFGTKKEDGTFDGCRDYDITSQVPHDGGPGR